MVHLPAAPSGKELEDYVAAMFQATGYYVDKNIIDERGPEQVLELDVVLTDYGGGLPKSTIVEVKSGGWGFTDIFKIRGWMAYLGIGQGVLFTSTRPPNKDIDFAQRKAATLDIRLICCPDANPSEMSKAFQDAGYPVSADDIVVTNWRWSLWVERRLLEVIRHECKVNPHSNGPREALNYYRLVNNGIFFEPDARERAAALYDAYRTHPRLSASICAEIGGEQWDPQPSASSFRRVLNDALNAGNYPLVQASLYLEHRARLALLKAAVDYVVLRDNGRLPVMPVKQLGIDDLWLASLPESFRAGLEKLRTHPNLVRYPYFWQVFLWCWGGFILTDRRDQEYEELSRQTGVPVDEIPMALSAMDLLFPGQGWIANWEPTSHMEVVKLFPMPFRGVGAFYRLGRYGVEDYKQLGYNSSTLGNLVTWHNNTVELLET